MPLCAEEILVETIQSSGHDVTEDASATMGLFQHLKDKYPCDREAEEARLRETHPDFERVYRDSNQRFRVRATKHNSQSSKTKQKLDTKDGKVVEEFKLGIDDDAAFPVLSSTVTGRRAC